VEALSMGGDQALIDREDLTVDGKYGFEYRK
jgi:hypothetical protein